MYCRLVLYRKRTIDVRFRYDVLISTMEITDPAFNYDKNGQQYSGQRKTDPRIAAYVNKALGTAKTVLNVGAGAGSRDCPSLARYATGIAGIKTGYKTAGGGHDI